MEQCEPIRIVANLQLVRMLIEQRRQRVEVAMAGSIEQLPVNAQRIHVSLERSPVGKAVFPGNGELRVGELGIGIGLAELLEVSLGLLAEPLEVLGRLHDTHLPSLRPPVVRVLRGEDVRSCTQHAEEGQRPFTRTVVWQSGVLYTLRY